MQLWGTALVFADKSTIQLHECGDQHCMFHCSWVIRHQQIQKEVVETVDRHVQAGSTAKQQGLFVSACAYEEVLLELSMSCANSCMSPTVLSHSGYPRGVDVIDQTHTMATPRAWNG